MLMNGMFIDPETNVYDLFAQIRREVSLDLASGFFFSAPYCM